MVNKDAHTALTSLTMNTNKTLYAIFKKDINTSFTDVDGTEKRVRNDSASMWNSDTSASVTLPGQGTKTGWTGTLFCTECFHIFRRSKAFSGIRRRCCSFRHWDFRRNGRKRRTFTGRTRQSCQKVHALHLPRGCGTPRKSWSIR